MNASRKVIGSIVDSGVIPENSIVIVGFSGGPDSLCMLHALNELRDSLNIDLVPVHINHKLRKAADAEAENCAVICERMGLDLVSYEADCKQLAEDMKISTEEAGRTIRYEIFDDVADNIRESGIPEENIVIAVAHNADDQSETVLFRLMRGTGLHGLAGILPVRGSDKGYMIVRPILEVPRSDVEAYIEENNLKPNIDESNASSDYMRNRIRNELIPYLEKNYNPNIRESLRRCAEIAAIDDGMLDDVAFAECEECLDVNVEKQTVTIDVEYAIELPAALLRRVVGYALEALGIIESGSYQLTMNIIGVMLSDNPSAQINLPNGFTGRRRYGKMIFAEEDTSLEPVAHDEIRIVPQIMMRRDYEASREQLHAAFDFDSFNKEYPGKAGELVLRTRKAGDFIVIKGGQGKKLQDWFVDEKIPADERDSIRLVAIGSEILWIIPDERFRSARLRIYGRFSQNYQITDTTGRVLFLELGQII